MTRAAICGGPDLVAAAEALGLVAAPEPDVVLVDTRREDAIARAAEYAPSIPRVAVASGATAALLRAAGVAHVAAGTAAEVVGPQVAAALPARAREATRRVLITSARGGVGRTLLATNLALRLGRAAPVWLLDATGTGTAGWWLRAEARPWSELEPMAPELSIEHLRVVATAVAPGVQVVGGPGSAPSWPLLAACLRALDRELAIVDAAPLADERTRALRERSTSAHRTLVLTYPDAASLAALAAHDLADAWLVASQGALPGGAAFRSLPRDDDAVARALSERAGVRGRLGRAYDDLAEILAIDAT